MAGHSGDVGNDAADLYANRGREGWSSPQWARGTETPEAWREVQDRDLRMVEVWPLRPSFSGCRPGLRVP